MSVYFAQVGRYIKVGFSNSPERRVANLFKSSTRYSAPRDIDITAPRHLLAAVPGGLNEERMAHSALDDFRVGEEWFVDEPEVRDFIALCVDCDGIAAFIPDRPAGPVRDEYDERRDLSPGDFAQLQTALDSMFKRPIQTPAAPPQQAARHP